MHRRYRRSTRPGVGPVMNLGSDSNTNWVVWGKSLAVRLQFSHL